MESGCQTCLHEDEGPESFLCEEGKACTSPSVASPLKDYTEGTVDTEKSCVTKQDCMTGIGGVSVTADHSILKTHEFLQQPSGYNLPQRPTNLEDLDTVGFDDSAEEPCAPDSLEVSPLMED